MMRGPQTKDELELYLAGVMCLIETGEPLPLPTPANNIHRRVAVALIEALNRVESLRPRFRTENKKTVWDGGVPKMFKDKEEARA